MPEVCFTATQIKIVKGLIVTMMGLSMFQAFTIHKLVRDLTYGRNQFTKMHDCAEYLLEIINEHNIELSEFDLIALTAISEGKNGRG